MKCMCEKESALCSVLGCSSSWGNSPESDVVQQSSMSDKLNLNMGVVLPQQCHKSRPLNLQFQEQDSSSTLSTNQSGQISIQHSNSSACSSSLSRNMEKSAGNQISSSMGILDFSFPPSELDRGQSTAPIAFHCSYPCYGGILAAAYGQHSKVIGSAAVRIPLPLDLREEPIYVNSKQYHAILRRRQYRAKLEAHNKLIRDRKPYLHESRHLHALKRARGAGGRFLNTKNLDQSKVASTTTTTSYQAYIGRDIQDYTADTGGAASHRRLSVLM